MNKKELVTAMKAMRSTADDQTAANAAELYPVWNETKAYD